jgi:hypothetical protein
MCQASDFILMPISRHRFATTAFLLKIQVAGRTITRSIFCIQEQALHEPLNFKLHSRSLQTIANAIYHGP